MKGRIGNQFIITTQIKISTWILQVNEYELQINQACKLLTLSYNVWKRPKKFDGDFILQRIIVLIF